MYFIKKLRRFLYKKLFLNFFAIFALIFTFTLKDFL